MVLWGSRGQHNLYQYAWVHRAWVSRSPSTVHGACMPSGCKLGWVGRVYDVWAKRL
jgi:hypothetical protein